MATSIKEIIKHSQIYTIGNIVNKGAAFVLIPLYTHYLSAAEYGVLSIILIVTEICNVVFGLCISQVMSRIYYDYVTLKDRDEVISTSYTLFFFIAIVIAIVSYPLSLLASKVMFNSNEHAYLFLISIISLLFSIPFTMGLNYLQIKKYSLKFLLFSSGKMILFLLLNIYFITVLRFGVIGIILGNSISIAILSIAATYQILKEVGIGISKDKVKGILNFALPLIPSSISDFVSSFADKYLINLFFTTAMVGRYYLGIKLVSIMHIFVAKPFAQIWVVSQLEDFAENKKSESKRALFSFFISVMLIIGVVMSFFSKELISIIASKDFKEAASVIPILAIAYVVKSLEMEAQLGIYYKKDGKLLSKISFITLAVNIVADIFLIKFFGIIGASIAILITNITKVSLLAYNSREHLYELNIPKNSKMMGFTIIYFLLSELLISNIRLNTIPVKFILIFIYILFFIPLFTKITRNNMLRKLVKKKL